MDNILQIVGLEGGEGECHWKIIAEEGQGVTDYYPAVDDNGNEVEFFDWDSPEEYVKHKVKKSRLTVRYSVLGNPIQAEEDISRLLDCHCMAVGPNTLDVYYATDRIVYEED